MMLEPSGEHNHGKGALCPSLAQSEQGGKNREMRVTALICEDTTAAFPVSVTV